MAKAARRGAKNPALTRLVRSVPPENAELCFENFMLSVEIGLSCRSNWVSNGRASLIKSLQFYKTPKPNSRSPFYNHYVIGDRCTFPAQSAFRFLSNPGIGGGFFFAKVWLANCRSWNASNAANNSTCWSCNVSSAANYKTCWSWSASSAVNYNTCWFEDI